MTSRVDHDVHHELSSVVATALMSVQAARSHEATQLAVRDVLDTIERELLSVAELTGVRVPDRRSSSVPGQAEGGS